MQEAYETKEYFKIIEKILKYKVKTKDYVNKLDNIFENVLSEEEYLKIKEFSSIERISFYKKFIRTELKKMENLPKSTLCKKIEDFGEIFNLTKTDIKVLKQVIYYITIGKFEELADLYREGNLFGFNIKYIDKITSIPLPLIEKSVNKLNNLGILDCELSVSLPSKIQNLFYNYAIYTKKQMIAYVLGDVIKSDLKINDFPHMQNEIKIIQNILQSAIKTHKKGVNILFWGDVGTGKTELVKVIAKSCKIKLYEVDGVDEYGHELSRIERLYDFKQKQEVFKITENSCLLFDEMEDIIESNFTKSGSKVYVNRILENSKIPTFWTINDIRFIDKAFLRRMTYAVEFKNLTDKVRLNFWQKELSKNKLNIDKAKLIEISESYDIPASLITNAIATTKMTNGGQDDFEKYVKSIATLINNGKNIKKSVANNDLNYDIKLVNTNLDIQNLTEKIAQKGKLNFSLCLYGQSGTGKSAYAKYLAKQLGIKVLLKRASDLMSPYVGQTEINIARAFENAKDEKAMLIIDEADSFLQSRQNAQRSWEISQVNEMLTCMENHDYPFVCTTNLVDVLDEASLRRFTFKIKFDFLKEKQIEQAFKHFFKLNAPQEIISCKCLTSGDFAVASKKAKYLDCENNPNEYAKLLRDEVEMKSKDIQSKQFGFEVV